MLHDRDISLVHILSFLSIEIIGLSIPIAVSAPKILILLCQFAIVGIEFTILDKEN